MEARAGTAPRPLSGILPPLSRTGGGCYWDGWRRTRIPNKGEEEEHARQADLDVRRVLVRRSAGRRRRRRQTGEVSPRSTVVAVRAEATEAMTFLVLLLVPLPLPLPLPPLIVKPMLPDLSVVRVAAGIFLPKCDFFRNWIHKISRNWWTYSKLRI